MKVIKQHIIHNSYSVAMGKKNNNQLINFVWKNDYGFTFGTSKLNKENTFQVRKIRKKHNCPRHWISENFLGTIRYN